jgi:peptide deformylase
MDALTILKYPDPRLRRVAKRITELTDEILERIPLMFEAMREDNGIGLAAPQVGWNVRLFVMNCSGEPDDDQVLLNPVITERVGRGTMEEGCLSLPGVFAKVERPTRIVVEAVDLEGDSISVEADGLVARCIQHELDHLEGVLFIDKVSPARRGKIKKPLAQLKEDYKQSPATDSIPA